MYTKRTKDSHSELGTRKLVLCFFLGMLAASGLAGHTQNILLTGYWPPTNEMLRQFSTDPSQNPGGWVGQNWEGTGYDVYAFFPECTSSGVKCDGDLEVDYQDVTDDFWQITDQLHPVAIMSYGLGAGPWEIEATAKNLTGWSNDYLDPRQPTPNPPDSSVSENYTRYNTLPMEAIRDAINASGLGVNAWIDQAGAGGFLCGYMSYHDCWYQSLHADPADPYHCAAAGFTHVGNIAVSTAEECSEIALRELIVYLDSVLVEQRYLTVTIDGNGTVDANPDQTVFEPNEMVTLTATPTFGATFTGWSGDVTSTDNPLTVQMDTDKNITATFEGGVVQYQLDMSVSGNGSVQADPNQVFYDPDTSVTVTAVPDEGYIFHEWTGDASGSDNPLAVTMDSNKQITANFVADSQTGLLIWGVTGGASVTEVFTLDTSTMTVTELITTASGTRYADIAVTPSGSLYAIGSTGGSGTFNQLFRLDPADGSILNQWTVTNAMNALTAKDDATLYGVATPGNCNMIEVTLDGTGAYSADVSLGQINAQTGSGGDIAQTPSGNYIAATASGTDIYEIPVVGGVPNPAGATKVCDIIGSGGVSDGFGGLAYDHSDPGLTLYTGSWRSPTIFTLDLTTGSLTIPTISNVDVLSGDIWGMDSAFPQATQYTLTMNIDGPGSVQVDPDQATYDPNDLVTLTAVPDADAVFVNWTGSISGTDNPTAVNINSDLVVTAHFQSTITQYELDITIQGGGSVQRDPDQALYDPNTPVTLTAVPDTGWAFDSWSGDAAGTDNPIAITMDSNKSVTATFVPDFDIISLIWGVTGSSNASEVFTLDPNTMMINKLTTTSGTVHADIAVTPSGTVYTVGTYNGGTLFQSLMRIDPITGAVTANWPLPVPMNTLTAVDDQTLLGGKYSGDCDLYRIDLDGAGDYSSAVNLGRVDSQSTFGGDITHTPFGYYIAATNSGSELWKIPVNDVNEPVPADATVLCGSLTPSGIGALAYDYNDPNFTLYAGSYLHNTIYTLDIDTCTLTLAPVVNPSELTYGIYGMARAKQEVVPSDVALSITVVGDGSVSVDPNLPIYPSGTEVTLIAVPGLGQVFTGWSGDIQGMDSPTVITMDSDKGITATFGPEPTRGAMIWGVTGSSGATSPDSQAEIFRLNTLTREVTKLATTEQGINFSDIAMTPSGRLYCLGSAYSVGGTNFKDFFRIDPNDGLVTDIWLNINPREVLMNALAAVSDTTLYAIEGGVDNPHLIEITLDASGMFFSAEDLGQIGTTSTGHSGGDLTAVEGQSYYLASLGGGQVLYQVDPADPNGATPVVTTDMSQIAGLAFDFEQDVPVLYGGVWTDDSQLLYVIDLTTGEMSGTFDLSAEVDWNVFGLTSVPGTLPLQFNQGPENEYCWPETTASFAVDVTSQQEPFCRWQKADGGLWNDIPDANDIGLEIVDANSSDIGSYRCIVHDFHSCAISQTATLVLSDLDGVDPVNHQDFAIFAADWLAGTTSISDINSDLVTDITDLRLFCEKWLEAINEN